MNTLQTILITVGMTILAGYVGMTLLFGFKMYNDLEQNKATTAQIADFINKSIDASQKQSANSSK